MNIDTGELTAASQLMAEAERTIRRQRYDVEEAQREAKSLRECNINQAKMIGEQREQIADLEAKVRRLAEAGRRLR